MAWMGVMTSKCGDCGYDNQDEEDEEEGEPKEKKPLGHGYEDKEAKGVGEAVGTPPRATDKIDCRSARKP